jgi:SAM-dependent methyltransferase
MARGEAERFGGDVARAYDRGHSLPADLVEELHRRITAATELRTGAMVLDAGAGTGVLAGSLLRDGYRYLGLDASSEMLRRFHLETVDLLRADLRRLPLAGGCIEVVVAFRVFGVIRGWRHAVRECVRVLRPDGYLVAGRVVRDPGSIAEFIRSERNQLLHDAGIATERPGANDGEVDAELAGAMEQTAGIGTLEFTIETTPRQLVEQNLSGWRIAELDGGLRQRLRACLDEAVEARTGGLEVTVAQPAALKLGVYRKRL